MELYGVVIEFPTELSGIVLYEIEFSLRWNSHRDSCYVIVSTVERTIQKSL